MVKETYKSGPKVKKCLGRNFDIVGDEPTSRIRKYANFIKQNQDKITAFCKQVFDETNLMVDVYNKVKKLECDYIKKLKLDKVLFESDLTSTKIAELNKIKKTPANKKLLNEYNEFLKKPLHEFRHLGKQQTHEPFVRVDIMIPDYKHFKTISLLEIEPFASGHGWYDDNAKECMNYSYVKQASGSKSVTLATLFYKYLECKEKKQNNMKHFRKIKV